MKELLNTIQNMYDKGVFTNSIESIKLEDFRSFEKNSVVNFKHPLTVLVGKNGSGKSTVLKLLKTISKNQKVEDYFFNTALDSSDLAKNYIFSYVIQGERYITLKNSKSGFHLTQEYLDIDNPKQIMEYSKNNTVQKPNINIFDFEFKSYIGAYEQDILLNNTSKTSKTREQKIKYVSKQSYKIQQNTNNKSKRKHFYELEKEEVEDINYILGKNFTSVKIIDHKYFNGTWGTTVLFTDQINYSELNSGSGEFIIANTIRKLNRIPNNSVILLDEPEISIHPGAQKRFMKILLKKIIKKKFQVIICTHSPSIVDKLPNICIKNFIINANNNKEIIENVSSNDAFYNLEYPIDKKQIIVEDDLAQKILIDIATKENLIHQLDINYFPGGAESIKTLLITAFSKTSVSDRYVILDGDKFLKSVPDYSNILTKEKTNSFYEKEFKELTGINCDKIKWGIDGNKNNTNTTKSENQKLNLIKKYIDFYKSNVFFLPHKLPEDFIFDLGYAKKVFPSANFDKIEAQNIENNTKSKLKMLSEDRNFDINSLYDLFIQNFCNEKKDSKEYLEIKDILQKIVN